MERECLKKTWWKCIKDDVNSFGLSKQDAENKLTGVQGSKGQTG